jgi:membrane protein DedA with SNARE-associated domain
VTALSSAVTAFAGQNFILACLLVYLTAIFIGNIASFTSFWVAFEGGFGAWGVPLILAIVFCAAVSGDLIWYTMGRTLRSTRLGDWIRRRLPGHEKLEAHIKQRGGRWILASKFVYGSFPILFTVGWTGMPFRRFFRNSLAAISLWLPVIFGVSYGLYASLAPLAAAIRTVRDFELLFLGALLLFLATQYGLVRLFGRVFKGGGKNRLLANSLESV